MVEGCANPGECKSRPARYFLKITIKEDAACRR